MDKTFVNDVPLESFIGKTKLSTIPQPAATQPAATQPMGEQPVVEAKKKATALPVGVGSLESLSPEPEITKFGQRQQAMKPYVAPIVTEEERIAIEKQQQEPTEEDYFTGSFGKVLRGIDNIVPIGIGDFVDDMARSVASGYRQGKLAEEADNLLLAGTKSTPEQIQKFIEANKNASQLGSSKEMQDYTKIYEQEGKGFWGVVKGLFSNPTETELVILKESTTSVPL
jgi:hypothetical protein